MSQREAAPPGRAASLPASVRHVSERLEDAGAEAWLTGESLLRHLLERPPGAFELSTSATPERCLELFARAVPTRPDLGVVSVPTGGDPVDVASFRRGDALPEDLAARDFSVLALAYRPATGTFLDPYGGLGHLEQRQLHCVGEPARCLQLEPIRSLRAARLVSEYGFAASGALESAVTRAADPLAGVPSESLRRELARLLLGDRPQQGIELLRRTGLEARLIDGTDPRSGELVAALPRELVIRMAGWLRGTRPRPLLRRLRFGIHRSRRLERLLAHHPLDECVNPNRDRALARLLRQLESADLDALFQMREWELRRDDPDRDPTAARKRLAAIRNGLDRLHRSRQQSQARTRLALDGNAVMQLLGCRPGRQVGTALRFAAEWVAADPSRNEPEALRRALLAWHAGKLEDPASSPDGSES